MTAVRDIGDHVKRKTIASAVAALWNSDQVPLVSPSGCLMGHMRPTGGKMSGSIVVPCLLAFLIGIVAGMRAMTAPAAISWAARLGQLSLSGTWLAFLGYAWTPWILTLLAAGRAGHRPAPFDAEPQGARPVRHAHPHGSGLRSGAHRGRRIHAARCDRGHRRRRGRHARRTRVSGAGWPRPSAAIVRPPSWRTRSPSGARSPSCWRRDEPLRRNRDRRGPGRPAAGRAAHRRRHDRRRDRAQARRGHVRQHRLHAHQDDGGERPGRLRRAPRRRLRRPRRGHHPGGHGEGQGARRHRGRRTLAPVSTAGSGA